MVFLHGGCNPYFYLLITPRVQENDLDVGYAHLAKVSASAEEVT